LGMNFINEQVKLNIASINWGEFTWINIEKPTEKEKSYLALNYPFHPLDLDDCLSRIQRPKLDEYKDYLFLVFHFPAFNKQAEVTESSQVSIFIGEKYLVTLHEGRLKPLMDYFNECKLSEERRKEVFSRGSAYLLYSIVDKLVDYCFPILNKIADNINSVEENIFSRIRYGTVRKISVLRRDIISSHHVAHEKPCYQSRTKDSAV
jgi:magnesium transporter